MGVLLGIAAGILLGVSDFMANRASRTISSASVSRTNLAVSGLIAPLLLFVKPVDWTLRDVVLATISGVTLSGGLIMLYRGYTVARMGIVAPTASVLLAAVPVLYDLVKGNTPSKVAASGMILGLLALVLTTYQRGGMGSVKIGVVLGVGAGLLFGVAFTLTSQTSDAAGLSPVLIQRVSGLLPDPVATIRQGADPGPSRAGASLGHRVRPGGRGRARLAEARIHQRCCRAGVGRRVAICRGRCGVVGDLQQGTDASLASDWRRCRRRRCCTHGTWLV
jgi:drug/metabolite transporter (DMT)-like permease